MLAAPTISGKKRVLHAEDDDLATRDRYMLQVDSVVKYLPDALLLLFRRLTCAIHGQRNIHHTINRRDNASKFMCSPGRSLGKATVSTTTVKLPSVFIFP